MILPWQVPLWERLCAARRSDRLAHALLLVGAQGLGKRRFADAWAAALVCAANHDDGTACGACRGCGLLRAGSHPDVLVISPLADSAQIKVDQIRDLIDWAVLSRQIAPHKLVIIDPAEAMNRAAANGLLKTLEEPPSGTIFMLVSHQPGLLPATIRSRCQTLAFGAEQALALAWLRESLGEPGRAEILLALAEACPLRALSYAETSYLDDWLAVVTPLADLAERRAAPVATAAAWEAVGLRKVLPILEWVVRRALAWRMGGPEPLTADFEGRRHLHRFANALDLLGFLRFHAKITEFMGFLNQASGLRESNLLEELALAVAPAGVAVRARRGRA